MSTTQTPDDSKRAEQSSGRLFGNAEKRYRPCYLKENEKLIRGKEIASGSYGVILKCRTSEGRECALKEINIDPQTGVTEGILREIDITRRLIHPNLLHSQSYRLDTREKKVYIATELGLGDLKDFMKRQGSRLSLQQRLNLLHQVVQGIAQLHRSLIAHLDIKPENVIVYNSPPQEGIDFSAKVIDFGLSLYVNRNLEKPYPKHIRLTLEFSPPEILKADIDRRHNYVYSLASDIWSLALLFLEILNERWLLISSKDPRPADVLEAINQNFGSPEITRKSLDRILGSIEPRMRSPLVELLSGMLILDPHSRTSIESILASPVFSGMVAEDGCQYIQPITPAPPFDINELLLIDFIFRKSSELDLLTETVFFAIDYYYRSRFHLNGVQDRESTESTLSVSRLLMATAFWIATKLIEPRRFSTREVANMFSVSESDLLAKEIKTIDDFRGIIYRQNLYNASCRVSDQLTAFSYLTQPAIYPLIDLVKWSNQCSNPEAIGPLPFRSFYPKTEYYKEFGTLRGEQLANRLSSLINGS